MSLFARFRRKKEDPEIARRAYLRQSGRIGEATVLDTLSDETGNLIVAFIYTVSGSEYQSSQSIDNAQSQRENDCSPASRITIRYDPRRPTNSVIV
jgi:hypothetical protein